MTRRYRILHTLPDLQMAGGQQVVLRTLTQLDPERFTGYLAYFSEPREMESMFIEAGITPRPFLHQGWRRWRRVVSEFSDFLREEKIDLVHIHGTPIEMFYGQYAAWRCGIPVVRSLHGTRPDVKPLDRFLERPRPGTLRELVSQSFVDLANSFLDRQTIRHFLPCSDAVRDSWLPDVQSRGFSDEQVSVCHDGVPVEAYEEPSDAAELAQLRDELDLHGRYPILACIGRLTHLKGIDELVQTMAIVVRSYPRAKLLLLGEGELRPWIEQTARELGLEDNICLLGQRLDLPAERFLALCDVFVFASRYEGLPLVIMEAHAAKKPVVAFRLPGFEEAVEHGVSGYLVTDRNTGSLASSILEVVENRERAQEMGEAGHRIVRERFSVEAVSQTLEAVYDSLLERPSPAMSPQYQGANP